MAAPVCREALRAATVPAGGRFANLSPRRRGKAPVPRSRRVRVTRYMMILVALAAVPAARADADRFPMADRVIVDKSARELRLMRDGEAFRTFPIALGLAPVGDKEQEGDNRTPEGLYHLDLRNPNSDYFLSIRISYPNAADRAAAREKGVDPGGQIMIHGQPNVPTYSLAYYRRADWTNGCIAVSNSDMIDIWLMTPRGVPIEILP